MTVLVQDRAGLDRGVPGVRSTGTQCLVLAAKP